MLNLACIYAVRNEHKSANYWLQAAFNAGEVKYHLIIKNPAIKSLLHTEKFQSIIKKMKLKLFKLRQNAPFFR